jgi:hypothetical protein
VDKFTKRRAKEKEKERKERDRKERERERGREGERERGREKGKRWRGGGGIRKKRGTILWEMCILLCWGTSYLFCGMLWISFFKKRREKERER